MTMVPCPDLAGAVDIPRIFAAHAVDIAVFFIFWNRRSRENGAKLYGQKPC